MAKQICKVVNRSYVNRDVIRSVVKKKEPIVAEHKDEEVESAEEVDDAPKKNKRQKNI